MYWNWLSFVLLAAGICFVGFGLTSALEDAFFGFMMMMLGGALLAGIYINTDLHNGGIRNQAAKAALVSQGFKVLDADTGGHQATILLGACQRQFVLRKKLGQWRLYVDESNGERTVFTPSLLTRIGKVCSADIR